MNNRQALSAQRSTFPTGSLAVMDAESILATAHRDAMERKTTGYITDDDIVTVKIARATFRVKFSKLADTQWRKKLANSYRTNAARPPKQNPYPWKTSAVAPHVAILGLDAFYDLPLVQQDYARELCAFLDTQTLPTKEDWVDKFISVLERKPGQRLPDDIPTLKDYQAQHRNTVTIRTATVKRYYAALKAGSTNLWGY